MHPLGGRRIVDKPDGIGYGRDRPELWLMPRAAKGNAGGGADATAARGPLAPPAARGPSALAAGGRGAAAAPPAAGLAAGGRDGGAPAPRALGPPNYYSG